MAAARTTQSIEGLDLLEELYIWEDDALVRRLLVEHPQVHAPLIHAARLVPEYLGKDARLSLGFEHDLDGNEPPRPWATIHTAQSPTEALATLDRFDQDWWLNVMPSVHHHLSFGLRFA